MPIDEKGYKHITSTMRRNLRVPAFAGACSRSQDDERQRATATRRDYSGACRVECIDATYRVCEQHWWSQASGDAFEDTVQTGWLDCRAARRSGWISCWAVAVGCKRQFRTLHEDMSVVCRAARRCSWISSWGLQKTVPNFTREDIEYTHSLC
jgi:hypothetical protein